MTKTKGCETVVKGRGGGETGRQRGNEKQRRKYRRGVRMERRRERQHGKKSKSGGRSLDLGSYLKYRLGATLR